MKITGSCHCGAITIEGEADPEKVGICHCTDCQSEHRLGVPHLSARSTAKRFKLQAGQPTNYVKTTADSGKPRVAGVLPELRLADLLDHAGEASRRPTWSASGILEGARLEACHGEEAGHGFARRSHGSGRHAPASAA